MNTKALLVLAVVLVPATMFLSAGPAWGAEGWTGSTLAVRLFGGLGYQAIGDVNTGLKGFSDSVIYDLFSSPWGGGAGGGYAPLHYGFDVGGDIIFQFSPNFGVGLGSGYIRTSRESHLDIIPANPALHDEQFTFTPEVSVVPLRASLFIFLPLGRTFQVSLNAGPEYYLASLKSNILDDYPNWWWNQREDKATGNGFGFHGGIGLEVRLTPGFSFLLEGQGRLAKIHELTGTRRYWTSFGYQEEEKGTLYYWTDLWLFKPFPYIGVNETLPSYPWQQNPRKAVLDLNGWSAVAGFVFRF